MLLSRKLSWLAVALALGLGVLTWTTRERRLENRPTAPASAARWQRTIETPQTPVRVRTALRQRQTVRPTPIPVQPETPLEEQPAARKSISIDERTLPPDPAAALTRSRTGTLKERGARVAYTGAGYAVTWGAGATDVAVAGSSLSLSLREARLGSQLLAAATTPAPQVDETDQSIFYRHPGIVERYHPRSVGLEQSFELAVLPEVRGDWSVTVAVRTALKPPPEGTRGERLDFGGITLSKAVAVDAAGRRLPLEMAFLEGSIRIVVLLAGQLVKTAG